jgi:hypothetical protein
MGVLPQNPSHVNDAKDLGTRTHQDANRGKYLGTRSRRREHAGRLLAVAGPWASPIEH